MHGTCVQMQVVVVTCKPFKGFVIVGQQSVGDPGHQMVINDLGSDPWVSEW
jgi:hypothetical protein